MATGTSLPCNSCYVKLLLGRQSNRLLIKLPSYSCAIFLFTLMREYVRIFMFVCVFVCLVLFCLVVLMFTQSKQISGRTFDTNSAPFLLLLLLLLFRSKYLCKKRVSIIESDEMRRGRERKNGRRL